MKMETIRFQSQLRLKERRKIVQKRIKKVKIEAKLNNRNQRKISLDQSKMKMWRWR
jgi:hypothetical protein